MFIAQHQPVAWNIKKAMLHFSPEDSLLALIFVVFPIDWRRICKSIWNTINIQLGLVCLLKLFHTHTNLFNCLKTLLWIIQSQVNIMNIFIFKFGARCSSHSETDFKFFKPSLQYVCLSELLLGCYNILARANIG